MHNIRKLGEQLFWLGGNDRRLSLFENVFPVPRGISYNAYLLRDQKTALLDTVDQSVGELFLENLRAALDGRALDYIIVNHMEPDHCATLGQVLGLYPQAQVVCSAKAAAMIGQFFDLDLEGKLRTVGEGDTLELGRHTLTFLMAPMVHWPEVMVTYDRTDKTLFSADAFGSFGAIGGSLFADEMDFPGAWLEDARRYYANIVGKYGPQVQALLNKTAGLELAMLCPLHGPIWRKDLAWYLDKYQKWSTYTPEGRGVLIAYASVYGHTQNAAELLSTKLTQRGVHDIAMYDVSVTHPSYLVAEAFRCAALVFASTTYNNGIFCNMETLLLDLKAHNLQNRKVGLIQNGSWSPVAGRQMAALLEGLKGVELLEPVVSLRSAVKEEQLPQLDELADAIARECGVAEGDRLSHTTSGKENKTMNKYVCDVCGWTYDEQEGAPDLGIAPGTKWEDLPEDFTCPLCAVGKDQFSQA